jgi:hypothetical protein
MYPRIKLARNFQVALGEPNSPSNANKSNAQCSFVFIPGKVMEEDSGR